MSDLKSEITLLLQGYKNGNKSCHNQLIEKLYSNLHQCAQNLLGSQRDLHTLQVTELVNEAYIKLFDAKSLGWNDREHFLSVAAIAMRRILIDSIKKKSASKRIPKEMLKPLEDSILQFDNKNVDLLLLDEALNQLEVLDSRLSQIVHLRFFAGFTETEVAELLDASRSTINREWKLAKMWLKQEVSDDT